LFNSKDPKPSSGNQIELGGFTRRQLNTLIILTVMTIAVLSGLGFTVAHNINGNPYPISPTLNPTLLTPLALPTFPATWTPEASPTNYPVEPTSTPVPTNTLLPSFTPYPTLPVVSTIPPQDQTGSPAIIGTSVAGRPLEVYRFGTGPSNRMIVADIHGGNEWNTATLADQLIEYLRKNPDFVPPEDSLYILRTLNPDGLARFLGLDGRVNDNGVDLNRNWDADWKAEWDRGGCWDYRKTTAGPYPNSEPETQALISFLLSTPMDALISYHSAALGVFAGGIPPDPNSIRLAKQIAEVTDYPYPPVYTGCIYTGALVDWTSVQGVPSVDLELTNHLDTDFDINLKVLKVLLNFSRE
jgi:predicted deacylase